MSVTLDEIIATYAALKLVEVKLKSNPITFSVEKVTYNGIPSINFDANEGGGGCGSWSGTRGVWPGWKSDLPYLIRKIAGMEE